MARRLPFFRVFYSTTYTTIYIICIGLLAITPGSMIWSAVESTTYQYIIMIGGAYVLTALIAIFIYSSRLYTNRSTLASVGKAYIPIEDGEVGKKVRKMIVRQLERSAIVAWESRPRDVYGEILRAEDLGFLPPEADGLGRNDYVVGREIKIDPAFPPWGTIEHPGWSSPSHGDDNTTPSLQFAMVIEEMPNLIEAKAVALAPADEHLSVGGEMPMADPVVADVLRRPQTMGMRDYLTQLSYLGLINPLELGQTFLLQYERARFGGIPVTEKAFKRLMSSFADLLAGMTNLSPEIVEQIRAQAGDSGSVYAGDETDVIEDLIMPTPSARSDGSSMPSPVTARTAPSRAMTPYINQDLESEETLGSVLHRRTSNGSGNAADARSLASVETAGSVVHHRISDENG